MECHPRLIELLTKFSAFAGQDKLSIDDGHMIEHQMSNGKKGQIQFVDGHRYEIMKRKDGQLQVVSIMNIYQIYKWIIFFHSHIIRLQHLYRFELNGHVLSLLLLLLLC